MIRTILMSSRNQKFLAACQASLVCLTLFSFSADAYSDSIILDMEPEVTYGNDIKIAGTISFDEVSFHAGIPVSIEIRDDTRNVIDAQSTTPNQDGAFYFVVSADRIKSFEGTEKSFAVTVYYGSPNPSLLNTKYSTTDSFKVVKPSEDNSIQNVLQEIDVEQSNLKQDTVAQTADTISEYPTNFLIVIAAVVLIPILVILLKIIKSRRMWKKAEILANKANKHSMEKTKVLEDYIR